ncbi:hypothetical protein AB6A40_009605 [Gnathostoma spinigerum]|uniref:MSP domain-containing protein n=1 Tax=Gnathostoma spinigerum TaxID=75299 RepID=A0ABD6ESR6_9BILA
MLIFSIDPVTVEPTTAISNTQPPIIEQIEPQPVTNLSAENDAHVETDLRNVRRKKSRSKRAATLRFGIIEGRPRIARVQVLLSNISERPMKYKLKCADDAHIAAMPSGTGYVSARASTRCVLTWHRDRCFTTWSDVPSPRLLLITQFVHGNGSIDAGRTSTRLIARVREREVYASSSPPVEQLMLDAVPDCNADHGSIDITSATIQNFQERNEYDIIETIVHWMRRQSRENLAALSVIIILLYLAILYDSDFNRRRAG